jgi:hydroxymethylbilane synthase
MTVATLRIGSRASALALVQARILQDSLAGLGVAGEIVTITTDGDVRAADTAWGEGAFVTAIEGALVEGRIDVAVHSAKDVPTATDPRLAIAAYLPREEPRDALVLGRGSSTAWAGAAGVDRLPPGARVGTDSPRRSAFLLSRRPDLRIHPIHGNVDTRLRRLDEGETDALVLAAAGLVRLGLAERIDALLEPDVIPPAPGQGALAIQVRSDDPTVRRLIARLDDRETRLAVELERAILAASGGGCRAPIGAMASVDRDELNVIAGYARAGGDLSITADGRAPIDGAGSLAASVVDELAELATRAARADGAPRILVTRALDRSAATALAIVDRHLAPWVVPCIAIEPVRSADLDDAVLGLASGGTADWVVVTSVNAVDAVREVANRLGVDLPASQAAGTRWATIGHATSNALRDIGIEVDFRPWRAGGEALGATLPVEPGTRILLPRGDLADHTLPTLLRGRGAVVRPITAYRTVEAPAGSVPLLEAAMAESPAAIVVTSGSTIRGLATLADRIGATEAIRTIPVVAIGPATAAEAARLGFSVIGEAATQDPGGIADAVAASLRVEVAG